MSPSWREVLYNFCLKTVYWCTFILGLLPAPYNTKLGKFQQSRAYLCYSIFVQCLFVSIFPLSVPVTASSEERQNNYMHGKIVLEISYYIGKVAREVANVVFFVELWRKRQQLIDLCETFQELEERYEQSHMRNKIRAKLEENTICKLFTSHLNMVIISVMYILLQKQPSKWYVLMVFCSYMQAHHLVAANMCFYIILSKMHLHFAFINKSLEMMSEENLIQNGINTCWHLYDMHFASYRLCLKIFSLCRSVTLFMLIKVYTSNVFLLYNAVLCINGTIKTNWGNYVFGILVIIVFYWDTMLMLRVISNVQTVCNKTSEALGYLDFCVEEKSLSMEFSNLISQFHCYLACHKLNFYIFGMFSLNESTMFQYFISALVHLIILMQFDLLLRAST